MANGCVKIEPPDETAYNGLSNQMVFTSELHAVKEEKKDTTCNAIGQKPMYLTQESSEYQLPSLEEISRQSDVFNIQITNIQGTLPGQNGFNDEISTSDQLKSHVNEPPIRDESNQEMQSSFDYGTQGKIKIAEQYRDGQLLQHMVTQENLYPEETEVRSPINQSSFHESDSSRNTAEQEKTKMSQQLHFHQRVSPSGLSHHPYAESCQTSLSGFQTTNRYAFPDSYQQYRMISAYHCGTQNGSSSRIGTEMVASSNAMSHSTVPLHHLAVQDGLTTSQMGEKVRYQTMPYHPEIRFLSGHNSHESLQTQQFHQSHDAGQHRSPSSCHCCCHPPSENESCYSAVLGVETQRPSVIMVPVSWNNSTSRISHVPWKVRILSVLRYDTCLFHPIAVITELLGRPAKSITQNIDIYLMSFIKCRAKTKQM